jgi:hypothetical protein
MSIGEILDRSFRLYRNHFIQFFLAVLLVQIPGFIASQLYKSHCFMPFYQMANAPAGRDFDTGTVQTLLLGTILLAIVLGIVSLLALGAVVHLVHDTFLGRAITIAQAYRRMLQEFGSLLRLNLVKFSILGFVSLLWLVPMGVAIAMRQWWVLAAWVVVGALPALFAYLWLALASIVLLLEHRGLKDTLKRSGQLMFKLTEKGLLHNNGFRISILLLVILAVKVIVPGGIEGPYAAWKSFEMFRDPSSIGQYQRTTIDSVVEFILMVVQTATVPFGLATLVLFYFDIRIRKEGLDLLVRVQRLKENLKLVPGPA